MPATKGTSKKAAQKKPVVEPQVEPQVEPVVEPEPEVVAKKAASPAATDPEIVVGRFYSVQKGDQELVGEIVAIDGTRQELQTWINGQPSSVVSVRLPEHGYREVSREHCYELSTVRSKGW